MCRLIYLTYPWCLSLYSLTSLPLILEFPTILILSSNLNNSILIYLKLAGWIANSADPDQTAPVGSSLIRVYIVCLCMSVWILKVNTLQWGLKSWTTAGPHSSLCMMKSWVFTMVLLSPHVPCLCKQYTSRSIGFWPGSTLFVTNYVNLA